MTDNPLWDLIQRYMDDPGHRYPPKPADLARETGVSEQLISKWKMKPTMPSVEQLARFSKGTGIGYFELLIAALIGRGYLPNVEHITIHLPGSSRAIDDFIDASPPSGWAGTNLIGTSRRGQPMTTLGGVSVDMSEDDDTLPAAAKKGAIEEPGETNI